MKCYNFWTELAESFAKKSKIRRKRKPKSHSQLKFYVCVCEVAKNVLTKIISSMHWNQTVRVRVRWNITSVDSSIFHIEHPQPNCRKSWFLKAIEHFIFSGIRGKENIYLRLHKNPSDDRWTMMRMDILYLISM